MIHNKFTKYSNTKVTYLFIKIQYQIHKIILFKYNTSQVSKIKIQIIHVLELTIAVSRIQLHKMQTKSTYIVQPVKNQSSANCKY